MPRKKRMSASPESVEEVLVNAQITVILVSHFFIDPLKSRWGIIKTIWEDQVLHYIVLAALVWMRHISAS